METIFNKYRQAILKGGAHLQILFGKKNKLENKSRKGFNKSRKGQLMW